MTDWKSDPPDQPSSGRPEPGPWLPPKLREKLDDSGGGGLPDWEPKRSSPLPAIIAGVVIVGVLVGGFVVWQSTSKKKQAVKEAAAAEAARAAAMDSLHRVATADSMMRLAAADSAKRDSMGARAGAAKRPPAGAASTASATGATAAKPKPAASGSGAAAAAGSSEPRPASSGYGIMAGSYLMEPRANSEKDRLAAATGLDGLVRTTGSGGDLKYEVILGRFSSRGEAERRAGALVEAGTLSEAQVVARPK